MAPEPDREAVKKPQLNAGEVEARPVSTFDAAFRCKDITKMTAQEFFDIIKGPTKSPEGEKRATSFKPRSTDVLTVTTPKTGQTWLLAMLRKLSLGKDYKDVDAKLATTTSGEGDGVPWLEHAKSVSNIYDEQPGAFRVYKSHLKLSQVRHMIAENPDTKFFTCLRQPHDVALSFFRQMRGMYVERVAGGDATLFDSTFTVNDFAKVDLGYEQNLKEWLSVRHLPNVKILFYEEILAEPAASLRDIAEFVGVALDAELEKQTLDATDYNVMSSSNVFMNVFPGGGTYGKGRESLSKQAGDDIDQRWAAVVEPGTGASSYEALYEQINGKPFPFKEGASGTCSNDGLQLLTSACC